MDLCKMGYEKHNGKSFTDLFTKPIDYKIHLCDENGGKEIDKDMYGDHICSGNPREIIEWLNMEYDRQPVPYRRIKPLIKMLEGYLDGTWDNLQILHYGY